MCRKVRYFEYGKIFDGLSAKFNSTFILVFHGYAVWSGTLRQVCPTIFGRSLQPVLSIHRPQV